jgi:hypothetical protein
MRQMWATVLALLGIAAFAETDGKKSITEEQKTRLTEAFGEKFVAKLVGSFAANTDEVIEPDASVLANLQAKLQLAEQARIALAKDKQDLESANASHVTIIDAQKKTIGILSGKPETDPIAVPVPAATSNEWDGKNEKYLGGVIQPFMAIDDKHMYNKRAFAHFMSLHHGISIPTQSAGSLDYESLKSDLGDYYRVRKQERIQSFMLTLPSLEKIFPLESGYQDQAALVNMFLLDDFSQADNTSSTFENVIKGGFKFESEIVTMYDVMFAHKFTDLKKLEKNWLGYLNREGSSTMKWSFIEFIMVEAAKKLSNERELRRISGIRINPTVNVPGTSLGASNGLRQFIKNQIAAFKIRPFVMGEWLDSTISDYVRKGTSYVPAVVRDSGSLTLYMSPDALTAYHRNNEALYGINMDYRGSFDYVKEYPNVKIVAVPNMAESQRMIWTLAGNIILLEDQPGEMVKFSFEQQDWSLKVWSNWKESLWAYLVGKKFASLAAIPTDFSTQLIFVNDVDYPANYYVSMTANDTTPSISRHNSLVSVANTAATAITDLLNVSVGQEVRLKCGNATNAVTIAATGVFSLLTAAWNPSVDDVLILKKRSDGKYIELARNTATSGLTAFAANSSTPSVLGGADFVTDANTAATAITILNDAIAGKVYTLYGAGTTYASTIANAGNFVLTAAMTLSSGSFIKLQKSAVNSKYYEISRG